MLYHTILPAVIISTLRQPRFNSSRCSKLSLRNGHGRCFASAAVQHPRFTLWSLVTIVTATVLLTCRICVCALFTSRCVCDYKLTPKYKVHHTSSNPHPRPIHHMNRARLMMIFAPFQLSTRDRHPRNFKTTPSQRGILYVSVYNLDRPFFSFSFPKGNLVYARAYFVVVLILLLSFFFCPCRIRRSRGRRLLSPMVETG